MNSPLFKNKLRQKISIKSYNNGKAKWIKMSKFFNPFIKKQKVLKVELESLKIKWEDGSDKLKLRKEHILEDSVQNFNKINLKKELKIEFVNEEKINDAGGLLREWVHIISN